MASRSSALDLGGPAAGQLSQIGGADRRASRGPSSRLVPYERWEEVKGPALYSRLVRPAVGSDVILANPGGMMPEILTESFCERCGTRYTFESAAPRKTRRLGQIKTLSKGMKNWVMSDDTSLDEAMAAARNDDDRELTSHQLDAFHATFNFCMNCRQYTCGNCWNAADGYCLTCASHLGHEILPATF